MTARHVVVTGLGVISPLGDSPEALHSALAAGISGLRQPTLFTSDAMPASVAGEVDFDPGSYLGGGNLRPLDRTARLAASAAELALAASGWSREAREEHEVGLVLGTMFGSVHTISAFDRRAMDAGPIYAKPLDFANSVINAAAGQTAIWHDLRGINSTVAGGTAAGLMAIAYAVDMIRNGRADALLAGGGEELCFESCFGFHRAGLACAASNGTRPRPVPFAADRNGFALGEGAALLMLEEEAAALRRGATPIARVRGHASAFDASRGHDAGRAARGVERVVGAALREAGLGVEEIDAVHAAANGSVEGDRHEARGLAAAFSDRRRELPLAAARGQLGEALGASGALAATAALAALAAGELPGVAELDEAEEGLIETPLTLTSDSRRLALDRVLVDAVGLDGNLCAVVLEGLR